GRLDRAAGGRRSGDGGPAARGRGRGTGRWARQPRRRGRAVTGPSAPAGSTSYVAMDLQDGEDARQIVEAIRRDGSDVVVSQLPGLVRAQTPAALVIRRETVESLLGRPWPTHELQIAIVSYLRRSAEWDA